MGNVASLLISSSGWNIIFASSWHKVPFFYKKGLRINPEAVRKEFDMFEVFLNDGENLNGRDTHLES